MEIVNSVKVLRVNWKHMQCISSSFVAALKESSTPSHRKPFVRYRTGYGAGPAARMNAEIDENADKNLQDNNLKPGKHPGILHLPKTQLPEKLRNAIEIILRHGNLKRIVENAEDLRNYLWSRNLPMEQERFREKAQQIEENVRMKDDVLLPFLSEEQKVKLNAKRDAQMTKKLRQQYNHWQPISYTRERGLEYIVARTAPEYAALCRIFHEISKRAPDFQPKTLCDFGSGVGIVSWAARSFWASSLLEHLCADVSWEMNDLADLLLRGGNSNNDQPIPALFFRQHLPESFKIRYDLVVSSFSLMELSSAKERLTVIDKLWKKTEEFLVVVEPGTNAGFRAVIEARNYILGLDSENLKTSRNCHVFSPCPNSMECPRFAFDEIPCRFEAKYRPVYPFHHDHCGRERYCYVVVRRGRPHPNEPFWPRLIEDPMIRPRHVICRMCTKDAVIKEAVLTKAKHSQQLRLIAKRSECGDLLPIKLTENLKKQKDEDNDEENL